VPVDAIDDGSVPTYRSVVLGDLASDPSAGHDFSFSEGNSGYPMVVSSPSLSSASAVGSSSQLNEIPTRSVSIDVVPYQSFGSRYQRLAADGGGELGSSVSRRNDETNFEPVESAGTAARGPASNSQAEYDDNDDEGEVAKEEGEEEEEEEEDANVDGDNDDDSGAQQQQRRRQSPHLRRSSAKSTRREVAYQEEDPDEDAGSLGMDGIDINDGGQEDEEEEDTRQAAKMGYRRFKKIKPKVIIVKKILPLSTTTFRG
jgi:hypothetical protein